MRNFQKISLFVALICFMNSCVFLSDNGVGPYEETSKTFEQKDFDELSMGHAFHVTVKKSNTFRVKVTGDKRDVEDLILRNLNGNLKITYSNWRVTRRRMDIEIDMPILKKADFSGASVSKIDDFGDRNDLRLELSGASKATFEGGFNNYTMDISGASVLELNGTTKTIDAEVSGASVINAFTLKADEVYLDVSGASKAKVDVAKLLKVDASGASTVYYRGNPKVESKTSGASKVEKD
jgi:hypothetical protein